MAEKLLPCPMCGLAPNVYGSQDMGYRIVCRHDSRPLGECSVTDNTEAGAVMNWNQRAPAPQPRAMGSEGEIK